MMVLPIFLSVLAALFLIIHVATLWIAWLRCRPGVGPSRATRQIPPITVVRPLCGIETFSADTLAASFALDYPAYELLFCVARADDPIVPMVRATIAAHPQVDARLLIGDDRISGNPKLNNMVKGWRGAAHEWIAFIDSNVRVAPDVLHRCVAAWRTDTGAVAAPPVGIQAQGFGAYLECAFLNTYEARWQYAVDSVGRGFAQGKMLFYRKIDLDRSAMRELAAEPAEDAATTKMVRRMGLRVRLAPPSPMPVGVRTFPEVWSRQLRWARLRRATFLAEFLPEILAGSVIPATVAGFAAAAADAPVALVVAAYLLVWLGAEMGLARSCGWPGGWRLASAIVVRDLLMPALWVGALAGSSYTWKGTALTMKPQTLRPEEGV